MARLRTRPRWSTRPTSFVGVDQAHPLARGLSVAAVCAPLVTSGWDSVTGRESTTRALSVSQAGWGFDAATALTFPSPVTAWSGAQVTVATIATVAPTSGGNNRVFWTWDSGANDGLRAAVVPVGYIEATLGAVGGVNLFTAAALVTGDVFRLVLVFTQGVGWTGYRTVNGGAIVTDTVAATGAVSGTPARVCVSSPLFGGVEFFTGPIESTFVAPRAWSATEAAAWLRAPYDVLRPLARILVPSAAPITYDTFRPSGTLSAGTWAPYPSGTLYGVTSDEDDATYAESSTGSGTDTLDLSFPAMGTPPAGTVTFYLRHAAGSDEDDITGSGDLAAPGGTGEGTGTVT